MASFTPVATQYVFADTFHYSAQVITAQISVSHPFVTLELESCKLNGLVDAQLEIVPAPGGVPDWGSPLGTAVVPDSQIPAMVGCLPGTYGEVLFEFPGVNLSAASQYALVLKGINGRGGINWRRSTTPVDPSNPYPGGNLWTGDDLFGEPMEYTDFDLQFDVSGGDARQGRAFVYLGSSTGLAPTHTWTADGTDFDELGHSVATAGDVNGDGYSDVIIGTNGASTPGALVYHGSSSGPMANPAWAPVSNAHSFGVSVATAGDVNGDGFSDVIVGAPGYDNGQSDEGGAFVYHGSSTGLALTPSWTAQSNQEFAKFGCSVATAGDVNGDGYSDIVVGSAEYDSSLTDQGRAFVYQGSASGLAVSPAWTAVGGTGGANFGHSVATAGDFNGDGYADIVVGAPYTDVVGMNGDGKVFVYHGSSVGLGSLIWTALGVSSSYFGHSVATAGDVNGDGYSDIVVGAPYDSTGGGAYVYHGAAAGLALSAHWTAESNQAEAHFGNSVATAGDVNGDGYSDVIVSAPHYDNGQSNEGRAYVYHGSASGFATSPAWTIEGDQVSAELGLYAVATAGDVNGDGFSDVIVGLFNYDNGWAYVFHGSPSGLAASPAWTVESNQTSARMGRSVATAGDVNGDGFSDVIVGADLYDGGQRYEGRAFVYHGSSTGLAASPDWTAEGNQENAFFGYSVATAGDVNGDGYSDVIVGAHGIDSPQTNEGKVFVYHGSDSGLVASPSWTAEGDQAEAGFGTTVATAGDVNGDGYSDVIVGVPAFDNGQTNEGRGFVYHGSALGLGATAAWTAESNKAGAQFGNSVATAGDVNADGYSDVIVGAHFYTGPGSFQSFEGWAYVYHGSASGLALLPAWTGEGNQASAGFGSWVASAGDINGDGCSDVIVGAPFIDKGQTNEGRAFLYLGNGGAGLDRIPAQYRADGSAPIGPLGEIEASFRLKARGRSPAGRGRVRMEWEVKPHGTPFESASLEAARAGGGLLALGSFVDTGAPVEGIGSAATLDELIDGLEPGTAYRWRLRVLTDSPFFPRSPWVSFPHNGSTEADLRTSTPTAAVPEPARDGASLRFVTIHPSPSHSRMVLQYVLPRAGHFRLSIHDVQGRRVAILADLVQEAGQHSVAWEGRNAQGMTLSAGTYFARLESGGKTVARKFVRY